MIRLQNIHKTYPRQLGTPEYKALDDISFQLQKGETMGLIGANGAGKSTTIKLILDFIRPDKGRITVLGRNPSYPLIRQQIGYLPEVARFPQNLTCMEMIRFAGETCGLSRSEVAKAAEKWLLRLDLWESRERLLRGFSKGMQQRASFAMALIHEPELLILDEPMSGLDPIGRAKIVELILELKREGRSILFCTHLLDDINRLVDKLLVLHNGQIRYEGYLDSFCNSEQSVEEAFLALVAKGDASL